MIPGSSVCFKQLSLFKTSSIKYADFRYTENSIYTAIKLCGDLLRLICPIDKQQYDVSNTVGDIIRKTENTLCGISREKELREIKFLTVQIYELHLSIKEAVGSNRYKEAGNLIKREKSLLKQTKALMLQTV